MLSGQLAPSSASFVPQPNYFIEENITETISDVLYTSTTEKINSSFFSNTTSGGSGSENTSSGISLPPAISTATTTITSIAAIATSTVTLSIPGLTYISTGSTTTTTSSQVHTTTNINETTAPSTANINCSVEITDARGRSAALERAYVHDVYENCDESTGPIRPRVAQFLAGLEPGSIVCDVGCGNGRYLTSCNPLICTIGVDRCYRLTKTAHERGGEVALCDNLELPFRDESFDAVLSLAVVHHFATTERRVGAIRELARILRIGGRVVISVWALEQRHRRFESQDVLIPWQPPKSRNYNLSDDEDDDDYLPPYHAYTEDSTNSSRSAGDGDSSSLSSSSPGESCYSFVRRAIQKLAGGRKHPWFLDSWNSKDTKNDSSIEYEDAKDLPIELRRLEDFEDFPDPPLSAGLKSRSLGSILNPPPRQIVRSRSSVPSLGAQIPEHKQIYPPYSGSTTSLEVYNSTQSAHTSPSRTIQFQQQKQDSLGSNDLGLISMSASPTKQTLISLSSQGGNTNSGGGRRPKLVKQKQSLCDEEYQLPDNLIHMMNNDVSYVSDISSCFSAKVSINDGTDVKSIETRTFLRKQSSLNEELMAESRLREKERIRKRIQKQMSLNETFLCRSLFTKRLQVIREGFTTKLKTSTGSLERVTKNGFVKIMQNFKASQFSSSHSPSTTSKNTTNSRRNSTSQSQFSPGINSAYPKAGGSGCNGDSVITSTTGSAKNNCNHNSCSSSYNNNVTNGSEDQKLRRHSRESGSDSSKDSSLQSDTSIESEDSFASVIFIPKPEQSSNHQQQNNMNSISSICNNNNNSNNNGNCNNPNSISFKGNSTSYKIPSVPTSPLIMPCPPTPAHSPAAVTSSSASTTSSTGHFMPQTSPKISPNSNSLQGSSQCNVINNRFTFDEEHIIQQQQQQQMKKPPALNQKNFSPVHQGQNSQQQQKLPKITRQTIQNLPQIPKFRKQQSLQSHTQLTKTNFPLVRRASAAPSVPKLLSLELFNPETDDLDSDSSEPSSPDSIDSVISALKPGRAEESVKKSSNTKDQLSDSGKTDISKLQHQRFSIDSSIALDCSSGSNTTTIKSDIQAATNPIIDPAGAKCLEPTETNKNVTSDEKLMLNKENSNNLIKNSTRRKSHSKDEEKQKQQQSFIDFAEQLSAQLLKKLEESNREERTSVDGVSPVHNSNGNLSLEKDEIGSIDKSEKWSAVRGKNKISNGEMGDMSILKEELRERRLMLANLSTQQNQQQSPTQSTSSSTSSQTRSFNIYDDSNEFRYSPSFFDSKAAKMKFLRNFSDSRQYSSGSVPDTAYLIPDNGGDSSFDDDEDLADADEIEHDVIMEEDEDIDDDECDGFEVSGYTERTSRNTIKCLENDEVPSLTKTQETIALASTQLTESGDLNIIDSNENKQLETRESTESWGHSNSTNSLDSPSQGGGSTTHHRYYHVFREGELDALINHHVASLHIVSSYYERASWCVVAEKVQVWTI